MPGSPGEALPACTPRPSVLLLDPFPPTNTPPQNPPRLCSHPHYPRLKRSAGDSAQTAPSDAKAERLQGRQAREMPVPRRDTHLPKKPLLPRNQALLSPLLTETGPHLMAPTGGRAHAIAPSQLTGTLLSSPQAPSRAAAVTHRRSSSSSFPGMAARRGSGQRCALAFQGCCVSILPRALCSNSPMTARGPEDTGLAIQAMQVLCAPGHLSRDRTDPT